MIDKGHGGSGVVGVRLVSSDVPRGWLQPCATSELSVVGACRAFEQASRAYEKKYRPCREQLERGSGSLGFASWAHNLSARMELKARGGCPNQTNLLIGHKAIATTVLWYCPGLTSTAPSKGHMREASIMMKTPGPSTRRLQAPASSAH